MKQFFTLLIACLASVLSASAQERAPHSSMWILAPTASSTRVNYLYKGEGVERRIRWGMDTAWMSENNVLCGVNHIGKEYLSYGRISFQPTDSVGDDLKLSTEQYNDLKERVRMMKASGVTTVLINSDHKDPTKIALYYYGKPHNWYNMIKASVIEAEKLGMTVESVAPMNEPDYTYNGQGTKEHFRQVCALLRADPFFDNIRISAGNTLNTDPALEWYNYMKPYVDEGNTHQLAGSFAHYAQFFETVRADGKLATADELHNTMEAFVGVEYGLQNGIWWGFDGVTRGRYCKASAGGMRLGYGESRNTWTAGCVYRLPDGSVDAFLGGSERQANTNTFELASQDQDVFYDGYGPTRLFSQTVPGGRGYQQGQTNAETTIHITDGADVASGPIADGTYYLVNPRSKKVLSTNGSTIVIERKSNKTQQLWKVEAVPATVGGDFCYFYLRNNQSNLYVNVRNWSTSVGSNYIVYDGGGGSNEQWHLIYAGDGDYYIQSRFSGLYLGMTSSSANPTQQALKTNDNYLRWRLVPSDAVGSAFETNAPAAPVGLTATSQAASVLLEWEANTETDLASYIVLRGEATTEEGENWQTIGRQITGTQFVDNSCEAGKAYVYKIKAVDKIGNRSNDSELVAAQPQDNPALIAHYTFDETLQDDTENLFDAVADETPSYLTDDLKVGTAALALNTSRNGKHYLLLPHEVGNHRELTMAMWIYWRGGNSWQRIFDFGNSTDQYVFLTPSNGSGRMSLGIKNGGSEETLTCTKALPTNSWHHVAVTISDAEIIIYVDGEAWATTESITIRPNDFRPGFNFIGRSQWASDPHFYGNIDDVNVWNYALSAEDVLAVMQGLPTAIATPSPIAASPVVSTEYFNMNGMRMAQPTRGLFIMKQHRADGSVTTRKVVR